MRIESGLKTDDPIRTRGWTNWSHLFHPRQLLMLAMLHKRIKAHSRAAELYFFMPRALDNSSRLNRWKARAIIYLTQQVLDVGRTRTGRRSHY